MKLLLHICCAHCLDKSMSLFEDKSIQVKGYFYNSNIHPLLEFRKRLKAVKVINQSLRLDICYHEKYQLQTYLREVWQKNQQAPGRCRSCYLERLGATAKMAYENGSEMFSTTMITSSQQNHEYIRQAGEEAAGRWGLEFVYRDLREVTRKKPKRRGIYSQQYCGCIFSEEERYATTSKELFKG